MKTRPGRPRGLTRLARALGLDRNPLRRATDRAEAWIRVGLLAVFLIAGPMAALGAGHWAYHDGDHRGLAVYRADHCTRLGSLSSRPRPSPTCPGSANGGRAGARGKGTGP